MTDHSELLSLLKPSNVPKIDEKAKVLEQQYTVQVLPMGIIDTKPLTETLQANAHLNADALRETSKELLHLRESITELPKPESIQPVIEKLDKLLEIFGALAHTAELENEVLVLVKAELQKE